MVRNAADAEREGSVTQLAQAVSDLAQVVADLVELAQDADQP